MTERQTIVVDTESNGLDPDIHQAVEIAWWNLDTDERGLFIPHHDVSHVLANAEIQALRINRYVDRIADTNVSNSDIYERREATSRLYKQLHGNTLAGSNPAFDAAMLRKLFASDRAYGPTPAPWHHRLFDLSAYARGVIGLKNLPGLAEVCHMLAIDPGDHTAEADVTATGLCFRKLMAGPKAGPKR